MPTISLLPLLLLSLFSVGQAFTVAPTAQQRHNPTTRLFETAATATERTIDSCLEVLYRAADTKAEDSDTVIQSLIDLEKLARKQDDKYVQEMVQNLDGSWRLIFTTGTKNTQEKYGKINYFPLKAVQAFDTKEWKISNGIYLGDFNLIQFSGSFTFDTRKRRLEFDFDTVQLMQFFDVALQSGQAAELGAKSGLGSESNVANAKKNKSAFFNWISADERIATARGGGGGLALWKRVV